MVQTPSCHTYGQKLIGAGLGGNMFNLNPFELALLLVFTVRVLIGVCRFASAQLGTPGRRRLFIYGVVLLASAAVFFTLLENKPGTVFAN